VQDAAAVVRGGVLATSGCEVVRGGARWEVNWAGARWGCCRVFKGGVRGGVLCAKSRCCGPTPESSVAGCEVGLLQGFQGWGAQPPPRRTQTAA
jgi:hypothetical protein